MWYIIGIIFLVCFILTIGIIFKDRLKGAIDDFLEINLSPEKYTIYCVSYEIEEDKRIMFLGTLKETGKPVIVFYPYGEKRIIVDETIESIKNKINGKS